MLLRQQITLALKTELIHQQKKKNYYLLKTPPLLFPMTNLIFLHSGETEATLWLKNIYTVKKNSMQ